MVAEYHRNMRTAVYPLALLLFACGDVGQNPPLRGSGDAGTQPTTCNLPLITGPCDAHFTSYGFDPSAGRCVPFVYGGCEGNDNRFESYADCQAECGGPLTNACGGGQNRPCGDEAFCDYPTDSCGTAALEGVCKERPDVCTDEYDPVCGCDGQTYGNLCEAHAAGVDAAAADSCAPPPDKTCGGRSGQACGPREFCDFGGRGCDYADAEGVCTPRPDVCPRIYQPVCGCDGITYSNLCIAQSSGVDAAHSGRCGPGAECSDRSDDPIVLGGDNRFGFCAGACVFEVTFPPTDAASPGECDGAALRISGHRPGDSAIRNFGALTPEGHQMLRGAAADLLRHGLRTTYGCPDCDDGGASGLDLIRGGVRSRHVYEYGNPPEALLAADALVQDAIRSLSRCVAGRYVQPSPACTPGQ